MAETVEVLFSPAAELLWLLAVGVFGLTQPGQPCLLPLGLLQQLPLGLQQLPLEIQQLPLGLQQLPLGRFQQLYPCLLL